VLRSGIAMNAVGANSFNRRLLTVKRAACHRLGFAFF